MSEINKQNSTTTTGDNSTKKAQDIDLIAMAKRIWQERKFVLLVTIGFMIIGLLVALFSPTVFTAETVIVPQTTSKTSTGSLSSLAAMAGINLGDMSGTETLSPKIYPQILKNVNFQKELMYKKIKFQEWDEPIALFDYYTKKEYRKFNLIGFIVKYTIGLPGTIIGAIRGEQKDTLIVSPYLEYGLNTMSKKESDCAKKLSSILSLSINEKSGYLTLSVNMPEAMAAAQVAEAAYNLLQKYITEFKLQNAKSNYDYIKARYDDAKKDLEEKQIAYAEYLDANMNLTSKVASIKQEQLKTDYSLSNTIYNELAKQLLQANLKVKEDTPILTQVKPVVVPNNKTKPKRSQILIIWTLFGVLIGCGAVLSLDWLKRQGHYSFAWWK